MGILDTLSTSALNAVNNIRAAWTLTSTGNDALGSFYGANPEAQEMFGLIEARIDEARSIADARGDRPTLEDYRQACIAFGETEQGQALAAEGRWNARVYSNLSGQLGQGMGATGHDLSEFALSEPQKRAMSDLMDLDSDGAINDFYTNIDFTGANLNNAYVDPATSFNEEIARAKNLDGLTFNNMHEGDRFEFGAGNYTNINMTNINGGEIVFGDGSRVDGLTVDGLSAAITMGDNARVNNVTVNDNFRIVSLSMGAGALLAGSDLSNATISMASEFEQGATLQNVQLGSNVAGLDFSGVTFNNVAFNSSQLANTSFAGATLNGVKFNDVNINTLDLSGVRSFAGVQVNGTAIASARDLQMMQLASNVTIPTWSPELNALPSPTPAQTANTAIDFPAAATAPTVIAFGGDVANLSEALAGYNPAKDAVARTQPEPSMGIDMPRGNA